MRTLSNVTLILGALVASPLAAQTEADPKPSDTVRLTFLSTDTPALARMHQLQVRGDSLHLNLASSSGAYPLSEISQIEISRGKAWSTKWGVLGFFGGAAAGALIAWPVHSDDYGVPCSKYGNQGRDGCVTLIAGGAILGAFLGAFLKGDERWEALPMDRLRALTIGPSGDGLNIGASLRF
jgi:hypothetical protein